MAKEIDYKAWAVRINDMEKEVGLLELKAVYITQEARLRERRAKAVETIKKNKPPGLFDGALKMLPKGNLRVWLVIGVVIAIIIVLAKSC